MDLHATADRPTAEEREAIEAFLDCLPALSQNERKSQLLPALHMVQDQNGWISPGALNEVALRLGVPPAEAYGVATFYALLSTRPQPKRVLHICDDIACKMRGADTLCNRLSELAPEGERLPGADACWKRSPCLGQCDRAPAAFFQCAGDEPELACLGSLTSQKAEALLRSQTAGIAAIIPEAPCARSILLERAGRSDPESLDSYRAHGGYKALPLAFEHGPRQIIEEVTASGLTGRGGAAFPTGVKWKAVAESAACPKYVICNADESEPGTFKDRLLMESDPFAIVEALTIAGYACGAERGWIYIRGEYPLATRRLEMAIRQARSARLLGTSILDSGFAFDIEIRRGGGAYICGEETALINSIEGRRGEPRNKPPFPVQHGLFGKPTVINNVETLANVLPILVRGAAAYRSLGTEGSPGTRLFCLSGCVAKPGVYEAEHGITLRDLISLAGGVRKGYRLQAVLLGGAAGVFIGPDSLDLRLTLEDSRTAGVTLGSGVVMLFDDSVDLREILKRIAAFFRDESCGQCVPCRIGTVRQEEALHRMLSNEGSGVWDGTLLAELEQVMKDASICGLGHTASSAIRTGLEVLRR